MATPDSTPNKNLESEDVDAGGGAGAGESENPEKLFDPESVRSSLQAQGISGQLGVSRAQILRVVHQVRGRSGSHHRYDEDEKVAAAEFLNKALGEDADCVALKLLPVDVDSLDFLKAIQNGIVLCKLVNLVHPNTIPKHKIIVKKNISVFEINLNLDQCLKGAEKIGCTVVNIGPSDITSKRIHICLGLVWQLISQKILTEITLEKHPELVALLNEDANETLSDLYAMPAEVVLLRWINYHLIASGSDRRIKNISSDISDSVAICILLSQLSDKCSKDPLTTENLLKRADLTLSEANKLNCRRFLTPQKLVQGHHRLSLAFFANLFANFHGLPEVSDARVHEMQEELHITVTGAGANLSSSSVEHDHEHEQDSPVLDSSTMLGLRSGSGNENENDDDFGQQRQHSASDLVLETDDTRDIDGDNEGKKVRKRQQQQKSQLFHTSLFGFDGAPNPPIDQEEDDDDDACVIS